MQLVKGRISMPDSLDQTHYDKYTYVRPNCRPGRLETYRQILKIPIGIFNTDGRLCTIDAILNCIRSSYHAPRM